MEKRRSRRRRVRVSLRLEPGGLAAFTGDLSATGLFVRSARVFAPGTPVTVMLVTPRGPAWAEGTVRWGKRVPSQLLAQVRGGFGVEFVRLSPELEAYMRELLPSPTPTT